MKLKLKLILTIALILFISATSTFVVVRYFVTNALNNTYRTQVKHVGDMAMAYIEDRYPGNWNLTNGELHKGNTTLHNNYFALDNIKELTGCDISIYLYGERIATTYLKEYYEQN